MPTGTIADTQITLRRPGLCNARVQLAIKGHNRRNINALYLGFEKVEFPPAYLTSKGVRCNNKLVC